MRLPKNLGISGAMNAGLQEILAGDHAYIARLDVGDMCEPERFAKQIAWLNAHPEIGILGSAVKLRLFDVANTLTAERILKFPVTPESCVRRLSFNCPASHPAMMIRREVFEQLKGYSEDYPAAEDFDLMWRANNMGFKIANLEEVLLIKDETPGSISQKRRRRQIFSRMRIQWENRRLLSPRFWAGIGKSALTLAAPASAINAVKFISRSR
jgi:GT2 family glycosyltransferase